MADEITHDTETDLESTRAQRVLSLEENNLWVQSRADADCIYDDGRCKTIEKVLPCDASVDKSQFWPRFREIGAAYIFDCRKKAEAAKFKQERAQLASAAEGLDKALREVGEFNYFGAGQWLAKAAREASARLLQIDVFLSNGENVLDLLNRAKDAIPRRKSGQPKRTVPALKLLLRLWHEATGRSALTRSGPSKSSDETCVDSFDEFEKFATAFVAPLRDAGFTVPDPKYNQAAKLLNRRRKQHSKR